MVRQETFMMGVTKAQLDEIHTKHPWTRKRGGIQKFVRELISLALMDECAHKEYILKAVEAANGGHEESAGQ